MDNFALIKEGIDVSRLMANLTKLKDRPDHLYLRNNLPTTPGTPAIEVEFYETPSFWELEEFQKAIFGISSAMLGTKLGGCMIATMPPKSKIPEHSDIGPCAYYYDVRIHLVLQSVDVDFVCGSEVVQMQTGDLWWFDLNKPHSLDNTSDLERIHLIMDIKSAYGRDALVNQFKEKCLYARK